MRLRVLVFLAVLSFLMFAWWASFADTFEKVFETGTPLPEIATNSIVHRLNFDFFNQPVGGPNGDVLITAKVSGFGAEDRRAWFLKSGAGAPVLLGYEDGPAPGFSSGTKWTSLGDFKWGRNGEFFFQSGLNASDGTSLGPVLYCLRNGNIQIVLSHLTSSSLQGTLKNISSYEPIAGSVPCTVLASVGFESANAGTTTSELGILKVNPTQNLLMMRFGAEAPGAAPMIYVNTYTQFSANTRGDFLLTTALSDSASGSASKQGLWIYRNGVPELLALMDRTAPGLPGFRYGWVGMGKISETGEVAFDSMTTASTNQEGDTLLFTNRSGAIMPIFLGGQEAPGLTGYRFHSYANYRLSSSGPLPIKYLEDGSLIFFTNLWGPQSQPGNPQMIRSFWKYSGADLQLLIKEDDVFIDKNGESVTAKPYTDFNPLSISPNGKMVFAFSAVKVTDPSQSYGVIVSNSGGGFRVVAQDQLSIADYDGYQLKRGLSSYGEAWRETLSGLEINSLGQILCSSCISPPGSTRGFNVPLRINATGQIRPVMKERQMLSINGTDYDVFLSATHFGSALGQNGTLPLALSTIQGGQLKELIVKAQIEEPSTSACPGDLDGNGSISVGDLFIFLPRWFGHDADFNHDGMTSLEDLFAYLRAYFTGCP